MALVGRSSHAARHAIQSARQLGAGESIRIASGAHWLASVARNPDVLTLHSKRRFHHPREPCYRGIRNLTARGEWTNRLVLSRMAVDASLRVPPISTKSPPGSSRNTYGLHTFRPISFYCLSSARYSGWSSNASPFTQAPRSIQVFYGRTSGAAWSWMGFLSEGQELWHFESVESNLPRHVRDNR